MRGLLIKNKAEKVTISAYGYYGADFKLNVFDQDTNTYLSENLQMSEGLEPIANFSATCNDPRTTGQEVVAVDDTTGLSINDRISVKNFLYRVAEVNGNDIKLHSGLRENLDGTETINKVGNMGIYSLDLNIVDEGTFLVQAKDSVFGLLVNDSVKVEAKGVREMIDEVNTNIDENEVLLTTSKQGWKVLV